MTSPDLHDPSGRPPNPGDEGVDIIRALAGGFLDGGVIFNVITGAINDALRGLRSDGALGEISDGQMSLINQVGFLNGVRGYCAAYQSMHINAQWRFGDGNERLMPFDAQLGPNKGASIDTTQKGIRFHEQGLWLIFATTRARNTGWDGSNYTSMFVDVCRPDGTVYSTLIIDGQPGTAFESLTATVPVVVPGPDYYVRIKTRTGRWRWWDGGTGYTRLAVLKIDNDIDNTGDGDVPSEPDPSLMAEGEVHYETTALEAGRATAMAAGVDLDALPDSDWLCTRRTSSDTDEATGAGFTEDDLDTYDPEEES
ncbi:hypothetical protein PQI66_00395 [Corynebacterium sp. USCH3]|uniref:hypothetical protein n=1 Tax=Corynebacterium sp. USCH3 TaxID=3024840 RepID=UPI0030B729EC